MLLKTVLRYLKNYLTGPKLKEKQERFVLKKSMLMNLLKL